MGKPTPRTCQHCGKAMGAMSFRWWDGSVVKRGYFHPDCFRDFVAALALPSPDTEGQDK